MLAPFDAAKATYPTRQVPLRRVVDLLSVPHDPRRIRDYRTAMEAGEQLPPISVIAVAGRFVVTDGHKRLTAFRQISAGDILVELWPLRRLAADLAGQHVRFVSALWRSLRGLTGSPAERAEARCFFLSTLKHFGRIMRSLLALVRR